MDSDLTLRDYLQMLRHRLWAVFVVFCLAVALAVLYSALQTPLYQSTARVLINQSSAADIFDSQFTQNTSYADRMASNEVALIESQLVRDVAQSRLGFQADIDASAQSRADVISVSAVDPDPETAQKVATEYALAYLDVRQEQYVAERVATAEKLFERISAYNTEIASAEGDDAARLRALRDDLADEYDRLNLSADLASNASARIIDEAELPTQPFSPRVLRNLALGVVCGMLAGLGTAVLLESIDRSVASREVIESLTPGVPSLAMIPVLRDEGTVVTLTKPNGVDAEVFATLRAAIEFASVDGEIKTISITSAGVSAGKTVVAANLAVSIAQSGKTVALIDGDLRRPRIHEIFGLEQVPGFTSAILGRESLRTAARELRMNNGRLRIYSSGPLPPGPAELLGSRRARDVLEVIRRSFDVVIIDTPPVLPVADALILSRYADATLLVANAKRTKRQDLERGFEALSQAGANLIGTVLNEATGKSLAGYGYGYGYGYGNASEDFFDRIFGRRNPAPRRAGTTMLDRSELPKFEAAIPTRREAVAESESDTGPVDDRARDRLWGSEREPDNGSAKAAAEASPEPAPTPAAAKTSPAPAPAPAPAPTPTPALSTRAETHDAPPAPAAPTGSEPSWGDEITVV